MRQTDGERLEVANYDTVQPNSAVKAVSTTTLHSSPQGVAPEQMHEVFARIFDLFSRRVRSTSPSPSTSGLPARPRRHFALG